MFQFFRNIKTGISNLVKWFPTIYNDRDWDHYYIYSIWYKKFDNMDKFFNSDKSWTAKSEGIVEQIHEVKLLCEKLMKDDYLEEALKTFDEKYGEIELFKIVDNKLEHNVDEETLSEYRECGKLADKNREDNKEMLFDLLRKNIDNFWD